jgi:hypothetical protein
MKKNIYYNCIYFVLLSFSVVSAQDLFTGTDLSTIQVDNLSNTDIVKLKTNCKPILFLLRKQFSPFYKGMSATEFRNYESDWKCCGDFNSDSSNGNTNGAVGALKN